MNKTLSLCFMLVLAGCDRSSNDRADKDAIQQQIVKYTAALDAASVELAAQVWDTSPDVSFISPAGHQHGWKEIQDVYAFFGSAFTERKLTTRDISIHVLGDAAWAEFYWRFTAKQTGTGAAVETDGRESQVYRRIGDRWALVHVHYSGPAMTFDPTPQN